MKINTLMSRCFAVSILLAVIPLAAASGITGDKACPKIAGFMIIGGLEHVTIKPEDLRLKARVDTGAQTSSIGVTSQQSFERDGKKWLRFSIKDPASDHTVDFEKPVLRIAKIKRHGAAATERPVVKLKIKLGKIEMEREFTLADRDQYKFPVLIGRNVLGGKYLVDVNRKFAGKQAGGKEE